MITNYGRDNAFLLLGIGVCLILLAFTPIPLVLSVVGIFLGLLLIFFTLWFFRDPERELLPEARHNPAVIVAPADGQVTEITNIGPHSDIGTDSVQISIFLSPLNLHVNRYPATGRIRAVRYFPGKYLVAYHPKASTENERSEFVLEMPTATIVFRQITGFLARRVVYDTTENISVHAGDRFGMMKFGSRMDVIVPATAQIPVKVGDTVRSAHTIIARVDTAEST